MCDLEPACFSFGRDMRGRIAELDTITASVFANLPDPTEAFVDPSPETLQPAEDLAYITERRHELAKELAKVINCETCPLIAVCQDIRGN